MGPLHAMPATDLSAIIPSRFEARIRIKTLKMLSARFSLAYLKELDMYVESRQNVWLQSVITSLKKKCDECWRAHTHIKPAT